MDHLPDAFERLLARLEALERRVDALERPAQISAAPMTAVPTAPATASAEGLSFPQTSGAFSMAGKAMLGIAGAYLLRAVAESSLLPRQAVAAIAIVYAILWLVAAARVEAEAWFRSTIYACTSALIFAPMLWELTLSFRVLSAAAAAGVLGGFVCAASALAWKHNLNSVHWVANLTAAAVAVALSIATHELEPFLAVLLGMVLLCELAATRNGETGVRAVVSAAADVAIWGLIFIYSSPQGERPDYPPLGTASLLAPALVLFLINGTGVALRTTVFKRKITAFETVQTTIALVLAAASVLYFVPRGGTAILGAFLVVLSAASYGALFVVVEDSRQPGNSRVFATWSAALFLAGVLVSLPPHWGAVCLGVAAIGATVLGVRLSRPALQFHGVVYLTAAAVTSGLVDYVFHCFAGTLPGGPGWSVCIASACAVICYWAQEPSQEEGWPRQFRQLVLATLAIGSLGALLMECLVRLWALGGNPGAPSIAFLRTLTICMLALALSFAGSKWRRNELPRIGYAALAVVAAKLVLEDMRLGHLAWIAASVFLFAITLIAVPKIAHLGKRT